MDTMRQLAVVCLVGALLTGCSATRHLTPVHVVFLTDCTKYSNWQSIGDSFSFKMSGQPGTVSRVMCCTPEEKANYDESLKHEVETWIAPSFAIHPKTGDHYAAYNKPEAVIDWLDNTMPKEEYVLVLDSDMVLRRPFLVEDMKPSPGWAIGARYTYMIGVANELADRHIPDIAKRNDTFAGPFGRRADQVGGFFFVHRDDLKRMSHGWLKYTEDVRADPEAYRLSGDVYAIHPGDKPWISEMYGYAFGAAKANVWHHWDPISMIYPQYEPAGVPKVMHYGLLFDVDGYKFDKHWHYDFDITQCPPWDFSGTRITHGIFKPPPHPSKLKTRNEKLQYYRDLLSVETVATLNAGFCDYHLRHCSPSQQLLDTCTEAVQLYMDVMKEVDRVEADFKCQDKHLKCPQWAKAGECERNTNYMTENCAKSCGACHSNSEDAPRPEPHDTLALLKKLRETLTGASSSGGGAGSDTQQTHSVTKNDITGDPDVRASGGAADPDSNKSQVIPHTESPKVTTAPPVKSPPPPRPSPPPPSPPPPSSPPPSPPSPPPPSPVVRQQPQHRSTHVQGTTTESTKARKDLLIRCYRMTATPREVRECVAAANKGLEWHKAGSGSGSGSSDGGGSEGKQADSGSVLEVTESRHGRSVVDHDSDDLRQLQEQLVDPPKTAPRSSGLGPTLAGLSTWQAVALWAVLVLVLLTGVPRLLRMRRRPRSGMRSE